MHVKQALYQLCYLVPVPAQQQNLEERLGFPTLIRLVWTYLESGRFVYECFAYTYVHVCMPTKYVIGPV